MKTIQLDAFAGVRNEVSEERFSPKDLSAGTNIELDDTGKPYRRLGTTVLDATAAHSIWASDEFCFCVRNGTIHRILSDMSFQNTGAAVLGDKVSYRRIHNNIYWTDGLVSGVLDQSGNRPWGITPPTTPAITAGAGMLREGKYLVAVTYVRGSGLESGASPVASIPVSEHGSLVMTLPVSTESDVVTKRVYVSDVNGEVPYLCLTLKNSQVTATVEELPASRTLALRTSQMGPPPPGTLIGYYKGRLYVAENNYLWYTQPYEYELVHRAMNYIGFTSPVKTFSPVSDGIYVGSEDATYFLAGDEPSTFERRTVAPYGTVLGTEVEIPSYYFGEGKNPTPVQMWMSKQGMCAGLDSGVFTNLTGGRYVLPGGVATGASLLKIRGQSPQLVTTLFS